MLAWAHLMILLAAILVFVGIMALVSWINDDADAAFDCQVLSAIDDPTAYGYDDVRAAILDDGHQVVDAGSGRGAPFRVPVAIMQIEGHDLRIYEASDEESRLCDSDSIGMKGWSVNATPVEWIGTPIPGCEARWSFSIWAMALHSSNS